MFCVKCGKELRQGTKFCRFCGYPVPEKLQKLNNDKEKTSFVDEQTNNKPVDDGATEIINNSGAKDIDVSSPSQTGRSGSSGTFTVDVTDKPVSSRSDPRKELKYTDHTIENNHTVDKASDRGASSVIIPILSGILAILMLTAAGLAVYYHFDYVKLKKRYEAKPVSYNKAVVEDDESISERDEPEETADEPIKSEKDNDEDEKADEETDQNNEYIEVYKDFLLNEKQSERGQNIRFQLIYIDEDNIPELILSDGSDHPAKVSIYKFIDNKAVLLGEVGYFGGMEYIDHGNKVHESTVYFGDFIDGYYTIDGNRLKELSQLQYYDGSDWDKGEKYMIDDAETSEQAYKEAIQEMKGDYIVCCYDDYITEDNSVKQTMHDINSSNIEKYLR